MADDLCPGSGQGWDLSTNGVLFCTACRTRAADLGHDPDGEPAPVPPHTVRPDGSVWVQAVAPKPSEPDPWAVALHDAFWLYVAHGALTSGTTVWRQAHAAAAEARRLAAADPAIRAAHWREAASRLDATGHTAAAAEVEFGADRIEKGQA